MTPVLAQTVDLARVLTLPWVWGLALWSLGLWGLLVGRGRKVRRLATAGNMLGLALLATGLPLLGDALHQVLFWLLALLTLTTAALAITAHNPVYTAVWFAMALLGVAGLFLLQQAHFLGVATIVVYAGAILVTFLFVLMLAQPDGHAAYDRISWSRFAPPVAVLSAIFLVAVVFTSSMAADVPARVAGGEVMSRHHMARLGSELFARHLVAVEVTGTLLLVALVGAIAIVIHGRSRSTAREGSR